MSKMPRRITREAYNEIEALVAPPAKTEGDRRKEEKKALSEERMKRWPDTLEAQRRRKEEAYWNRLNAQEEARKKLDQEEDDRRAKERREKIDYAAKTIYRNTDKIKRLASAELLSDCLHVRDHQVKLKQTIQNVEKEWEDNFVQRDRERLRDMEAREIADQEERSRKAKEVASIQQEQLAEVRQRFVQGLKEEEEEGKRILEAAATAAREAKEEQNRRRDDARRNHLEVLAGNEELRRFKEEQKRKEEEEDEKIQEYGRKKAELKERQRKQFEKIESEKQRRRDDMIEQGIRRLNDINAQNNQRLENEMAEARRLEDERYRLQAEQRAAFAKTIDDSRRNQIEQRKLEKERANDKERDYAIRWREFNKALDETELLETEAEKRAARQHAQIVLNQAQEKHERLLDERREEIFQARALADQEKVTLDDFKKVALERIDAVKKAGKNPYPLTKCMHDVLAGR